MTILVVDDDANARELLRRLLGQEGFAPLRLTASVEEALAFLDAEGGAVRAVLMDYAMPGRDGVAGCQAVRAHPHARGVPVIMVSTDDSAAARVAARRAGAAEFVPKPFDRALLCGILSSLLEERPREQQLSELEHDVERAAAAQRELLRDAPRRFANLEMCWRIVPGSGLSGDYVNVFVLDETRLGFCLADVVGHGIGSALFAVSLHGLLSPTRPGGWVRDEAGLPRMPDAVAAIANREFPALGGERYFTLIYGIVEPATGRLQCVQAGHPGLIHGDAAGAQVLVGGDLPIGMFASATYQSLDMQLGPGSRVLVYSDGLTEARRGGSGEAFGQERLLQLVKSLEGHEGEHLADEILRSVRAWRHPARADDDQSLLVLSLR